MAKKVKVTFVKSPSGAPFNLAYWAGDSTLVDVETAKKLLDAGIIEVEKKATKRKTATQKETGAKR
jgi:hypothetical protein